jgi:hypothetical protein
VFEASYGRLVRSLWFVVSDYEVAQEIAQEAFAELYQQWPRVSQFDHPDLWVRRVVLRKARRELGRTLRRRRLERRAAEQDAPPRGIADVSQLPDPALVDAIRSLPPRQRMRLDQCAGRRDAERPVVGRPGRWVSAPQRLQAWVTVPSGSRAVRGDSRAGRSRGSAPVVRHGEMQPIHVPPIGNGCGVDRETASPSPGGVVRASMVPPESLPHGHFHQHRRNRDMSAHCRFAARLSRSFQWAPGRTRPDS